MAQASRCLRGSSQGSYDMDREKKDPTLDPLLAPLIEQLDWKPPEPVQEPSGSRTAIYARRSITDPEYESIGIQIAKAADHCDAIGAPCDMKRNVFIDRHRSGKTLAAREGLAGLLAAIAAGSVDIVVVKGIDRITRSHRDAVMLDEYFKKHRVSLHVAGHGLVNDFSLIIGGYQAQVDRGMILERMNAAREAANRAGMLIGCLGKYGYDRIDEWPFLRINEMQAAVIRRGFAEMDAGSAFGTVIRGFNRDGIPPPRGEFWASSISKHTVFRDSIVKGLYKSRDSAGPIEIPVPSLQIVEPEVFDRIEARYASVRRIDARPRTVPFVTPEIRCSCGDRIQPQRTVNCSLSECRRRERDAGCNSDWMLPTAEIARRVLMFALEELLDPERAGEWNRIRGNALSELTEAVETQRESLSEEIASIDKRMADDPNLGFVPGSLAAVAQRHRLELRQIRCIESLRSLQTPGLRSEPMAMPDAELRIAIKQMLIGLPNMRFEHIDPVALERIRELVPMIVVETDEAGQRYTMRFRVGIPGVPEAPFRSLSLSDPRWITRSFPRPTRTPLDFPETVLAHHRRAERGIFEPSQNDLKLVRRKLDATDLQGYDLNLVVEAVIFSFAVELDPEFLPERYFDVLPALSKLHGTRTPRRMISKLREKGSVEVRELLGPPRGGNRPGYASPIL